LCTYRAGVAVIERSRGFIRRLVSGDDDERYSACVGLSAVMVSVLESSHEIVMKGMV
jgi:hypothetical protein